MELRLIIIFCIFLNVPIMGNLHDLIDYGMVGPYVLTMKPTAADFPRLVWKLSGRNNSL